MSIWYLCCGNKFCDALKCSDTILPLKKKLIKIKCSVFIAGLGESTANKAVFRALLGRTVLKQNVE